MSSDFEARITKNYVHESIMHIKESSKIGRDRIVNERLFLNLTRNHLGPSQNEIRIFSSHKTFFYSTCFIVKEKVYFIFGSYVDIKLQEEKSFFSQR